MLKKFEKFILTENKHLMDLDSDELGYDLNVVKTKDGGIIINGKYGPGSDNTESVYISPEQWKKISKIKL